MKLFLFIFVLIPLLLLAAIFYAKSPNQIKESVSAFRPAPKPLNIVTPKKLRIVSYNIGYASDKANNKPASLTRERVEKNLNAIIIALKKIDADIIVLQEVDFDSNRTHNINQLDYLRSKLAYIYGSHTITWNHRYVPWPYWPPTTHFGKMLSGQAILSKYPLYPQKSFTFSKPSSKPFWYNWFYLERILDHVKIDLGKFQVQLFHTHLEAYDQKTRISQARTISEHVEQAENSDVIIAGDLNSASFFIPSAKRAAPGTEALRRLISDANLQRAEGNKAFYSHSSWDPWNKIDHILFKGPHLKFVQAGNMPVEASDHLPIWAEFEIVQ